MVLWHCFIIFRLWPVWATSAEIPCHLFFFCIFSRGKGELHHRRISWIGSESLREKRLMQLTSLYIWRVQDRWSWFSRDKALHKIKNIQKLPSWWLNQPIWKICLSNWIISTKTRGENSPQIFESTLGLFPFACLGTTTGAEAKLWLWWIWIWRPRRRRIEPMGYNEHIPWRKIHGTDMYFFPLPTIFYQKKSSMHVDKYASPMEHMGYDNWLVLNP